LASEVLAEFDFSRQKFWLQEFWQSSGRVIGRLFPGAPGNNQFPDRCIRSLEAGAIFGGLGLEPRPLGGKMNCVYYII